MSKLSLDQHFKAYLGNMNVVEAHITAGGDVNATDSWDRAWLHAAASSTNIPMAEYLLERGANINMIDKSGHTPLMKASSASIGSKETEKHTAMLAFLLSKGAHPNTDCTKIQTPLYTALTQDNIDAITLLLGHGSNPNHTHVSNPTAALLLDVESKEAATLLLHYGANPFSLNYSGRNTLEDFPQYRPKRAEIAQVLESHMHELVKAVKEKKALNDAALPSLLDPHLIPDLTNIVRQYQEDLGEVTIQSLSTNPDKEPDPERKSQLLMQQSLLQEVLNDIAQERKEEKAASAAQAAPSPSDSAPSGSAWSARISPRAASAAAAPSAPLDHAMRSKSPSSMER